ncbi:MAG TPA: VWA domain-containing protein, partial [Longimicrobiales bacterium]|nr:VWA domain-containing protein [Longimicrobiales bacterium]
AALHSLLASLSPRDRFRLIAFSDQVRSYNQTWMSGTRESIRDADQWVDNLRAEGGTNISGALEEAFRANSSSERVPFVVFVTDGLPSIGETNPERIAELAEHARGRTRVFAFGVGYDVNTYLLDRLSAAARGSTQYVKPGESVERAVGTMANRIRFPVLTDLKIANTPVRIEDVYPRNLPDLFAGEELIILGRYSGSGSGEVSVVGQRSGRGTERAFASAEFKAHELGNDFIPKLWASRKVGFLSQQLRLRGHNQELVEELRETALRYGVLSEYTSYLVQEAPPPVAVSTTGATGRGAVMDASKATLRLEAKSVAAANEVAAEEGVARVTNAAAIDEKRYATVAIEPFSEAYFAMLKALPELKPFWRTSAKATVDGKNIRIKLTAGGVTRLDASRITEIVKKFRT